MRFCALCGKETSKIIRGLCIQHYLEKHETILVPEIKIDIEKNTGRIRERGKWTELSKEKLEAIVASKAKTTGISDAKITAKETGPWRFTITATGKIDGEKIEAKKQATIKPVLVQSDAEMKLKSSYHEAIIQLRFKSKAGREKKQALLEEALEILAKEKKKDELAGASGIEYKREGIDVMIGSKRAAKKTVKKLSRKYNAETKTAFKIIGLDSSGKEKKRLTYSVRI